MERLQNLAVWTLFIRGISGMEKEERNYIKNLRLPRRQAARVRYVRKNPP